MNSRLSVIIVTYNRLVLLQRCLESLALQSDSFFDLVVVDNGSRDQTLKYLRSYSRERRYINIIHFASPRPLFFCKESAIRQCDADYVAFLDDDCRACEQWVSVIKERLRDHAVIGGPVLPPPSLRYPFYWRTSMNWLIGVNRNPNERYLPLGSNCAFHRALFELPFFSSRDAKRDDSSLPYAEDNFRIHSLLRAGYTCTVVENMKVTHMVGQDRLRFRYFIRRSIAEGKSLAVWQRGVASLLRNLCALMLFPLRFIVTLDPNRICRACVNASYIYHFFFSS